MFSSASSAFSKASYTFSLISIRSALCSCTLVFIVMAISRVAIAKASASSRPSYRSYMILSLKSISPYILSSSTSNYASAYCPASADGLKLLEKDSLLLVKVYFLCYANAKYCFILNSTSEFIIASLLINSSHLD